MTETEPDWRKSSYCADGACVEVARKGQYIAMRDGKNPDQAPLEFMPQEWDEFLVRISADGPGSSEDI